MLFGSFQIWLLHFHDFNSEIFLFLVVELPRERLFTLGKYVPAKHILQVHVTVKSLFSTLGYDYVYNMTMAVLLHCKKVSLVSVMACWYPPHEWLNLRLK